MDYVSGGGANGLMLWAGKGANGLMLWAGGGGQMG